MIRYSIVQQQAFSFVADSMTITHTMFLDSVLRMPIVSIQSPDSLIDFVTFRNVNNTETDGVFVLNGAHAAIRRSCFDSCRALSRHHSFECRGDRSCLTDTASTRCSGFAARTGVVFFISNANMTRVNSSYHSVSGIGGSAWLGQARLEHMNVSFCATCECRTNSPMYHYGLNDKHTDIRRIIYRLSASLASSFVGVLSSYSISHSLFQVPKAKFSPTNGTVLSLTHCTFTGTYEFGIDFATIVDEHNVDSATSPTNPFSLSMIDDHTCINITQKYTDEIFPRALIWKLLLTIPLFAHYYTKL